MGERIESQRPVQDVNGPTTDFQSFPGAAPGQHSIVSFASFAREKASLCPAMGMHRFRAN